MASSNVGTTIDQIFTEYLDDFFADKEIAGGLAYSKQLKMIDLDYTSQSIDRIDDLLNEMYIHVKPDRDDFFQNQEKANFMLFLAMYLCSYMANSYGTFFRLFRYDDPDTKKLVRKLPQTYENSIICILDDQIYGPLDIVARRLFAPDQGVTCREFVDRTMGYFKNKVVRIPRDVDLEELRTAVTLYESKKNSSLFGLFKKKESEKREVPEGWHIAMYQAGVAAGFAMSLIVNGGNMKPGVLAGNTILGSPLDNNPENAIRLYKENASKHKQLTLFYQGQVGLPVGLRDAVVIRTQNTEGENLNVHILVPFVRPSNNKPFKFLRAVIVEANIDQELWVILFDAFNRGLASAENIRWGDYFLEDDTQVLNLNAKNIDLV